MSAFNRIFGGIGTETRDTVEDLGSLERPGKTLLDLLVGDVAAGGVRVTSESILTFPPVYRGVWLLSMSVAKLPLLVYEKVEGGRRRATDHPAYKLLKHRANKTQTAFMFKLILQQRAVIHGNGFAYIERNEDAKPHGLHLIEGKNIATYRVHDKKVPGGGETWYTHVPTTTRIPWRDMIHVRGIGTDLLGYSLADKAKESMSGALAAQKYSATFFANNARADMFFEHPGTLSDTAKAGIIESWNKKHAGPDNAFRVAVLEEGMKASVVTPHNDEAQLLETRAFDVKMAANWLNVPPHKLGDETKTSYASLEQENQAFLDESVDPWLVAWESEIGNKLLAEIQQQRDTHSVEFLRQALVRANMETRSKFYTALRNAGAIMGDEIRERENLNALPGDIGQKVWVPTNMFVYGEEGNETPQQNQKAVREAHAKLLADVGGRMARRLAVQARKAQRDGQLEGFGERVRADHLEVVTEAIAPVLRAYNLACGTMHDARDAVDAIFEALGRAVADGSMEDFEQNCGSGLARELIGGG